MCDVGWYNGGMREIKFRAWDEDNNIMYLGVFDWGEGECWRKFRVETIGDIPNLMQYTGLHDKNGKEIYEGDIIDVDGELTKINTVEWFANGWYYSNYHAGALPFHIISPDVVAGTVIGNIYENKDLLK